MHPQKWMHFCLIYKLQYGNNLLTLKKQYAIIRVEFYWQLLLYSFNSR